VLLSDSVRDRARLFTVVDVLEADLRALIRRYLSTVLEPDDLFGTRAKLLRRRAAQDGGDAELSDLVDYADFDDSFGTLNAHSKLLPDQLARKVREGTPVTERIVPIRNRIMYGRPLRNGDPEAVQELANQLVTGPLDLPRLKEIVLRVGGDPAWTPGVPDYLKDPADPLHNLPVPDFDETGLIGRQDELDELLGRLLNARTSVVTVIGEGGVGKSALATQALWQIVDLKPCPFEAVIWSSLKTERLDGSGISEIAGAARDLAGAVGELGAVLDESFYGSLEDLSDALDGIPALLVIDNIETVDGAEVLEMIDLLPETVSFLFTSRLGLGDVERRVELGPLSPRSSSQLLRSMAAARNVQAISTLDESRITSIVQSLRFNPLGFRFFVEAVDSGRDAEDVLANQHDLLRFCVEGILSGLSSNAKSVLDVLAASDHPVSVAELTEVSDLVTPSQVREGIQELRKRSLVEIQAGDPAAALTNKYQLGATATEFAKSQGLVDDDRHDAINAKFTQLRRASQQRRRREADNPLNPYSVSSTSAGDSVAASRIENVLAQSRRRSLSESVRDLEMIRGDAPSYFEVDRVEAWLRAINGEPERASMLYEDALSKATTDEHKAKVQYFWAWLLSNESIDEAKAELLARDAHVCLELPATAQRYGRTLMYRGKLDEAEAHFAWALEQEIGHPKLKRILWTDLVDLYKRRLEASQQSLVPAERWQGIAGAIDQFYRAANVEKQLVGDFRLQRKLSRLCGEIIRSLAAIDPETLITNSAIVESFLADVKQILPIDSDVAGRSEVHVARLRSVLGEKPGGRESSEASDDDAYKDPNQLVGVVKTFSRKDGCGWLYAADGEEVFFHGLEVVDEVDQIMLVAGVRVAYDLGGRSEKGLYAKGVVVDRQDHRATTVLAERQATVAHFQTERHYAFVEDQTTGNSVFLSKNVLAPGAWDSLAIGDTLICQYEAKDQRCSVLTVRAADSGS